MDSRQGPSWGLMYWERPRKTSMPGYLETCLIQHVSSGKRLSCLHSPLTLRYTSLLRAKPSQTCRQVTTFLPDDASSRIFFAPQASVPVTGNIWGLLCTYRCSEVSEDHFTILNRRINTSEPAYIQPTVYYNSSVDYFYTIDGSSISVLLN